MLLIERGGGDMTFEATLAAVCSPSGDPGAADHRARLPLPSRRDRWLGGELHRGCRVPRSASAQASRSKRLKALAADPVIPLGRCRRGRAAVVSCAAICTRKASWPARAFALAMRGLLALIAIEVARLAASRARTGTVTLAPTDSTVEALRRLVEEHFRKERLIAFYAEKLAITPDRLNDHVKRASGVTAGHLIRQRVLTEAEAGARLHRSADPRRFAYDLGFADPSHFARFFRKQIGMTPQAFREGRGG